MTVQAARARPQSLIELKQRRRHSSWSCLPTARPISLAANSPPRESAGTPQNYSLVSLAVCPINDFSMQDIRRWAAQLGHKAHAQTSAVRARPPQSRPERAFDDDTKREHKQLTKASAARP